MVDPAQSVTLGSALTTAAIAAAVGGAGWICAYFLTGWRDDRTKRLQLELERTSVQIKEFYAPLKALTDQLDTTVNVLEAVVKGKEGDDHHRLVGLVYVRFFLPIHEEINSILKTKAHLLEGAEPPPSFKLYFEHYATEKAYWNLKNDKEDVSNIRMPPFPPDFYTDVREGYSIVIKRYEDALEELRRRRLLFNLWPVNISPRRLRQASEREHAAGHVTRPLRGNDAP